MIPPELAGTLAETDRPSQVEEQAEQAEQELDRLEKTVTRLGD